MALSRHSGSEPCFRSADLNADNNKVDYCNKHWMDGGGHPSAQTAYLKQGSAPSWQKVAKSS